MPSDRTPGDQTLTLLRKAAILRASGQTWIEVAKAVGRTDGTCANWPGEYPEVWTRLYAEASAAIWDEAEAEARHVARNLLRSKEEKIRQASSATILQAAARARPQRIEHTGKDGGPVVILCELPSMAGEAEATDDR